MNSNPLDTIPQLEIVKTILSAEGKRKVEFFRRDDGSFGFEEWHWQEQEASWCPFGKYSISFTDSLASAVEEARGRVAWMNAQPSMQQAKIVSDIGIFHHLS